MISAVTLHQRQCCLNEYSTSRQQGIGRTQAELGMVVQACNPGTQQVEAGGSAVQVHPQLHEILSLKEKKVKKEGGKGRGGEERKNWTETQARVGICARVRYAGTCSCVCVYICTHVQARD